MAAIEKSKEKILYILKTLKKYTDEENSLSTKELIKKLSEYGIYTERKSVYRDLQILEGFGVDKNKEGSYFSERTFDQVDLLILIGAIQTAQFISSKKSILLIEQLKSLTSIHKAKDLEKNIFIDEKIKSENEQIYYVIDAIYSAITSRKKVSFQYSHVDDKDIRKLNKKIYHINPYQLVWVDQFYYLIGNYDKYDDLSHYRIDKIYNAQLLEDEVIKPLEQTTYGKRSLDMASYMKSTFSMFAGVTEKVEVKCQDGMQGIIFDKFGRDVPIIKRDNHSFNVVLDVVIGDGVIRWLIGFGDQIEVITPLTLRETIRKRIKDMHRLYE